MSAHLYAIGYAGHDPDVATRKKRSYIRHRQTGKRIAGKLLRRAAKRIIQEEITFLPVKRIVPCK